MSYPFSALVGQPRLATALLAGAVDPRIGGVLVRGHKGTAKSTAVRALAALLPHIEVAPGCPMNCPPEEPAEACPVCAQGPDRQTRTVRTPLVELPVGAGEDQLIGSIDLQRALSDGVRCFQPGLLARAHRGVLYVDEVNLLDDHLVDVLLDAAAMGVNHVEREGVSVRHPARFQLIGTMNPEEGELRPQLLDRFGLTVEVAAPVEPAERAEVVRRRLAYDTDPGGFAGRFADAEGELAGRLVAARARLGRVMLSESWLVRIAAVCAGFQVDGLRADIVVARASAALAAWHGRAEVGRAEVREACLLALPHRRRRGPFDDPGIDEDELDRLLDGDPPGDDPPPQGPTGSDPPPQGPTGSGPSPEGPHGGPSAESTPDGTRAGGQVPGVGDPPSPGDDRATPQEGTAPRGDGQPPPHRPAAPEPTAGTALLLSAPDRRVGAAGRRSRGPSRRGAPARARRFRTGEPVRGADLALAATLRAAALRPGQRSAGPHPVGSHRVEPHPVDRPRVLCEDLRRYERRGRQGHLIVFCVDASGSMGARARMGAVKGAVRALLFDAYQRRDLVAMVTFRDRTGQLALPPTAGVELAERRLAALPTGGRTPLAAGLVQAGELVRRHARRDPDRRPLLVAVTDGRANAGEDPLGEARRAAAWLAGLPVPALVVDTEQGFVRTGFTAELAARLAAPCVALTDVTAGGLARTVRLVTAPAG